MIDELSPHEQVLAGLPASIRGDFVWCPARRAFGHQHEVIGEDTVEVRNLAGLVRTYTVTDRRCVCGDVVTSTT